MIFTKSNKHISKAEILQTIKEKRWNEFLIVVPTNRKLRALKKELIENYAEKLNIETLSTLTSNLLRQERAFSQLDPAIASVLLNSCAAEVKLEYLSVYRDGIPTGTLEKIQNIIKEYKRHGVSPEALAEEAKELSGAEKAKALDISRLYAKFKEKCEKLNSFEVGDVYEKLLRLGTEKFKEGFRSLYPNVNFVYIRDFDEFTTPEIEIVNNIADSGNLNFYIDFDYYGDNEFIFSHLNETLGKLKNKGFVSCETEKAEGDSFIESVKNNLFRRRRESKIKTFKDSIIKISCAGRNEEIKSAAEEIKILLTKENVRPNDICVVFNSIQNYAGKVRDVFTNYGIPFNLTDRLKLSRSLPVIALISSLEILENDFYYKNLLRTLYSGFVDVGNIDAGNLYEIASELKVVSGYSNWIGRLNDKRKSMKSEDEPNENKIARFERALKDIKQISDKLKPFEEKTTFAGFVKKMKDFIRETKIADTIIAKSKGSEEVNIKALTVFVETIERIFSLLESENEKEEKRPLSFYLDYLRTTARTTRYNIKERSDYGVLITTPDEIRGFRFDYLFVSGLADGDFPLKYSPEIFYSKTFFMRKALNHLHEQRFRFYQTLAAKRKKLYLTYPASDGRKELIESTFLKEFSETFELTEAQERHSKYLFTKDQYISRLGNELAGGRDSHLADKITVAGVDAKILKNRIDIEKRRNDGEAEPDEYGGRVSLGAVDDAEAKRIEERLNEYSEKEFSVSQLENFAKCPFKFFGERILNLQTKEDPSEEIEALELGSVLHQIFFEFYTEIRNEGVSLREGKTDQKTINYAKRKLFTIAKKKLDAAVFSSPLAFLQREKILGYNGDKEDSILSRFVETERKLETGKPSFFETSFGTMERRGSDELLSSPEPIKIGNVKLRGKIDRVDLTEDGAITVIDYKLSGKSVSAKDLNRGIQLQLQVYLQAVYTMLSKVGGKDYKPLGMGIYSLKFSDKDFGFSLATPYGKRKRLNDDEKIAEILKLINNSSEKIIEYVQSISEGKFNLSEWEDREKIACKYCSLSYICRVAESGN
ncbi:MAG: hypothetical protein GXO87_03995 [Chlorobi bacterium]|nr:hypothetical protein [Chlorobiota bacterium]